jgi:hypothetical protein
LGLIINNKSVKYLKGYITLVPDNSLGIQAQITSQSISRLLLIKALQDGTLADVKIKLDGVKPNRCDGSASTR